MARQVYLEDKEIELIISALTGKTYSLLKEVKNPDSAYNRVSDIRDMVDAKLQQLSMLTNHLESIKDGKLSEALKKVQERL